MKRTTYIISIINMIFLLMVSLSMAQESLLVITDMKVKPTIITPGGEVLISCRISHAQGPSHIVKVRATAFHGNWITTFPMLYDDGTNGDSVPKDGIFSLEISGIKTLCVAKIVFHAVDTDKNEIDSDPIFLTIQ